MDKWLGTEGWPACMPRPVSPASPLPSPSTADEDRKEIQRETDPAEMAFIGSHTFTERLLVLLLMCR